MTEETKHTGWTVVEHSWEETSIMQVDEPVCLLRIHADADEDTQEQYEAVVAERARLIAASPDLLAACSAAEFLLAALCVDRDSHTRMALRAAIRKAEGSPQ